MILFLDLGSPSEIVVDASSGYFILGSIIIRPPHTLTEENSTQYAQNRVIEGDINRDFFGDSKRKWTLEYLNTNSIDYDTIRAIYDDYLTTGSPKTWETTATNYTIASTNVHIDLSARSFGSHGTHYLSDFTLTLTEN